MLYEVITEKMSDVSTHQSVRYPRAPLEVTVPQHHDNLLLLVVRDLRADQLNNIDMPNLARYASLHQSFTNHLAGDNQTATSSYNFV